MDRNGDGECISAGAGFVALLAEGVDRNFCADSRNGVQEGSPSSQRAWIEIRRTLPPPPCLPVALLAEGVDRNTSSYLVAPLVELSPSSQRAWIEIMTCGPECDAMLRVALLAEGVDRNRSRPAATATVKRSPSSQRAWIEIRQRRGQGSDDRSRPPRRGRG